MSWRPQLHISWISSARYDGVRPDNDWCRWSWSRFVGQAANEADVALGWCGGIFWHQWQVVLQRFEHTGPSIEDCRTHQTEVNYNNPGNLIWTPELKYWQLLMTVTGLLHVTVSDDSTWTGIMQWREMNWLSITTKRSWADLMRSDNTGTWLASIRLCLWAEPSHSTFVLVGLSFSLSGFKHLPLSTDDCAWTNRNFSWNVAWLEH